MRSSRRLFLSTGLMTLAVLWAGGAQAAQWTYVPGSHRQVIGRLGTHQTRAGDLIDHLARQKDLGYDALVAANPRVTEDDPDPNTVLILPTQYILPDADRTGIVVNLAEKRGYFFEKNQPVMTFPVGIGREGWSTPLGDMHVIGKQAAPRWYPPQAIRDAFQAKGVTLPAFVPAGPDNPLGHYAIRLSKPSYLIHGTNDPYGVGKRSSAGCLRLYPEDIKVLFEHVHRGTPVHIVHQPFKLAEIGKHLYLENHEPLSDAEHDVNREDSEHRLKTWTLKAAMKHVLASAHRLGYRNVSPAWVKTCLTWNTGMPLRLDTTHGLIQDIMALNQHQKAV